MMIWRQFARVSQSCGQKVGIQVIRFFSKSRSLLSYHVSGAAPPSSLTTVDLRSDTLTLPSPEMLQAMTNADLGDDVYGEDPTVNALQTRMAAALGKESALFLASGTMGNLVSVMAHCEQRGSEVILGSDCHVHVYEQGGLATLAGVHHREVQNKADGTFDLSAVRSLLRNPSDPHYPISRAILVENTHNKCGGRVLPLSFLAELRELADELGLAIHMDGARVMNAAVALDVDVREILGFVDSVSMCFSKGIGAPFGAIVAGKHDFVQRTVRHRKAVGGAFRQAGVLAAAAAFGFEHCRATLTADHRRARLLASRSDLALKQSSWLRVEEAVESNMVLLACRPPLTAVEVCRRLAEPSPGTDWVVRALPASERRVRMVTHVNVGDEDVNMAAQSLGRVGEELERSEEC